MMQPRVQSHRAESPLPSASPFSVRAVASSPVEATAARALVEVLLQAGVDTFFGIPGGPVSPLFDAVLTTPRARLVESRHETSAAFAAAGYWRATGKTPAILVTAGPGVTNAVTGVASAHLSHVPMLVLCGDVAWARDGRRLLQDSGAEGVHVERTLGKFVRAAIRVTQPRAAATQALAALYAARDTFPPAPRCWSSRSTSLSPPLPSLASREARSRTPSPRHAEP